MEMLSVRQAIHAEHGDGRAGQGRAEGPGRKRSNSEAACPRPGDQKEDVAQEHEKPLMPGRRPLSDLQAKEPFGCASHRDGYRNQQIAGRECQEKSGKPWAPAAPAQKLAVKDEAEDACKCLPDAIASLYRVTNNGIALLLSKRGGSKFHQRPQGGCHESLSLRLVAHDAPLLTRITAS